MAKGKEGRDNNYTPIKNPELLQEGRETKSLQELAAAPKQEAKKDGEGFRELVKRTIEKEIQPHREKIEKYRSIQEDKNKVKDEPEKDKE